MESKHHTYMTIDWYVTLNPKKIIAYLDGEVYFFRCDMFIGKNRV